MNRLTSTLIVAATVIAVTTPCFATDVQDLPDLSSMSQEELTQFRAEIKENMCREHAKLAANMMRTRQTGIPLSMTLENHVEGSPVAEVLTQLAVGAYAVPEYDSAIEQERAVVRFRAKSHADCMQNFEKVMGELIK